MVASMFELALVCAVTFIILVMAEYLKRRQHIRGELARKFVHMGVGSFVASWPFFMQWWQINILCVAFIVVVLLSRHFHVFRAIHGVQRPTWGDVLFPIGIGITSLITHSPWIFAAAILHLSLGDGIAAVVGQRYARQLFYRIAGQKKSYVGSAAFLLVSCIVTSVVLWFTPVTVDVTRSVVILLPIVATIMEGLSIYGIDNVTVPASVAIILSTLHSVG